MRETWLSLIFSHTVSFSLFHTQCSLLFALLSSLLYSRKRLHPDQSEMPRGVRRRPHAHETGLPRRGGDVERDVLEQVRLARPEGRKRKRRREHPAIRLGARVHLPEDDDAPGPQDPKRFLQNGPGGALGQLVHHQVHRGDVGRAGLEPGLLGGGVDQPRSPVVGLEAPGRLRDGAPPRLGLREGLQVVEDGEHLRGEVDADEPGPGEDPAELAGREADGTAQVDDDEPVGAKVEGAGARGRGGRAKGARGGGSDLGERLGDQPRRGARVRAPEVLVALGVQNGELRVAAGVHDGGVHWFGVRVCVCVCARCFFFVSASLSPVPLARSLARACARSSLSAPPPHTHTQHTKTNAPAFELAGPSSAASQFKLPVS